VSIDVHKRSETNLGIAIIFALDKEFDPHEFGGSRFGSVLNCDCNGRYVVRGLFDLEVVEVVVIQDTLGILSDIKGCQSSDQGSTEQIFAPLPIHAPSENSLPSSGTSSRSAFVRGLLITSADAGTLYL
jgi:hypothetical protein